MGATRANRRFPQASWRQAVFGLERDPGWLVLFGGSIMAQTRLEADGRVILRGADAPPPFRGCDTVFRDIEDAKLNVTIAAVLWKELARRQTAGAGRPVESRANEP